MGKGKVFPTQMNCVLRSCASTYHSLTRMPFLRHEYMRTRYTELSWVIVQEKDNQAILALIARRVAELYKHMSELHSDSMGGIAAAQNYTETVEDQMNKQDAALLSQIQVLVGHANDLDKRENTHWEGLVNKQNAQEQLEAVDRNSLTQKIDTDVGSARSDLLSRMAEDKAEVHEHVRKGIRNVTDAVDLLRDQTRTRDASLGADIARMIQMQEANNSGQEALIAYIKNDSATFKTIAVSRLTGLDAGLERAGQTLVDTQADLRKRIDDKATELTNKLDGGISQLNTKAANMRSKIDTAVARLEKALADTTKDLTDTKVELKHQRDQDVATLSEKIHTDTSALGARMASATRAQNVSLSDKLDTGMSEAAKNLADAVSELDSRRTGIKEELSQFRTMQEEENKAKGREIEGLQSDADVQKKATKTLLAALEVCVCLYLLSCTCMCVCVLLGIAIRSGALIVCLLKTFMFLSSDDDVKKAARVLSDAVCVCVHVCVRVNVSIPV